MESMVGDEQQLPEGGSFPDKLLNVEPFLEAVLEGKTLKELIGLAGMNQAWRSASMATPFKAIVGLSRLQSFKEQVLCDSRRAAGLQSLVITIGHENCWYHPDEYAGQVPDISTILASLPLLPNLDRLIIAGECSDHSSPEINLGVLLAQPKLRNVKWSLGDPCDTTVVNFLGTEAQLLETRARLQFTIMDIFYDFYDRRRGRRTCSLTQRHNGRALGEGLDVGINDPWGNVFVLPGDEIRGLWKRASANMVEISR